MTARVGGVGRRWRRAWVVLAVVASVIVWEGAVVPRAASAAPAQDFVLDIPVDGFDRGIAERAFSSAFNTFTLNELIDETIGQEGDAPGDGAPGGGVEHPLPEDMPGTWEFTETGFRLVVPADEIQTTAEPWVNQIIVGLAAAAGIATTLFLCNAATDGGLPYFCKSLAGAVGMAIGRIVGGALAGEDMTSPKFWAGVLAAAIVGAALGGFIEFMTQFSKVHARTILVEMANAVWRFVQWLGSWASKWSRDAAEFLRGFLPRVADELPTELDNVLRRIGYLPPSYTVLPLGDSITDGWGSSSGAGFRGQLFDALSLSSRDLDFVGTRHGTGPDGDHQGHPGFRIDQIRGVAECAVGGYQPDVITLMAGTNDLNQNHDVAGAPQRLISLIDWLNRLAPRATVLVSTLVPSTKPDVGPRVRAYNDAIRPLIRNMGESGKRVRLVELASVTTADLSDQLHPNDEGYRKIANAFTRAFYNALGEGIVLPRDPGSGAGGVPDGVDCASPPPGGWQNEGKIFEQPSRSAIGVHLADVTGDERADYLAVANGTVTLRANTGSGATFSGGTQVMTGAPTPRVEFANVVGDTAADLVSIGDAGQLTAWRNDRNASGTPRFTPVGVVAPGVGEPGSKVLLADMNGDGRDDYLVDDGSRVFAWLNTPGDDDVPSWEPLGEISRGVRPAGSVVRFADINSDGRDDYLSVWGTGSILAWRNTPGDGGKPSWAGLGQIAVGVEGGSLDKLRLADLDGDRDADYGIAGTDGSLRAWRYDNVNKWASLGIPVAAQPGGVVWFAQMNNDRWADPLFVTDGRVEGSLSSVPNPIPNGPILPDRGPLQVLAPGIGKPGRVVLGDVNGDDRDDYLLVGTNGSIDAWLNTPGNDGVPSWSSWGQIAPGVGATGNQVRVADINGDRRADYLVVSDTGSVEAWLNTPGNGGKPSWSGLGTWAAGVGGAEPANVRFADVDGDDKADYLKVGANGSVDVWLNQGGENRGGWLNRGTWAVGVGGATQDNVLFPDLNADGLADYVLVTDHGLYGWTSKGGN